jgi:CRISPR-associated protein Cmr2
MSFDHFAKLATEQACPKEHAVEAFGLASGFVDGCTVWSTKGGDQRNDARRCYMERAVQRPLELPQDLRLDSWPPELSHESWLAIEVEFELLTPWYSKDDRLFHVLDNPVRKDRVFGVPFMAPASWKGMLRWACRMQEGLREHLEQDRRFEDWCDPDWILHLFGNEKGEERKFHQGALVFYPTWFDKIGFEVINPHDRGRRAGTQPIHYEVVPGRRPKPDNPGEYDEGGKGALHLLYAPWPKMKSAVDRKQMLANLLKAIEALLTIYGISAKRTVGWGTAKIKKWRARRKDTSPIEGSTRQQLLEALFPNSEGAP